MISPDLAALLSRMSSISLGSTPPLVAEHHPLVERHQDVGKNQVLRQFRLEPHPGSAAIVEALAHRLEQRLRFFIDRLVAADHKGEGAALRAGGGSGAGSVEKIGALGLQRRSDLPALARADGAGVGDGRARPDPLDDPLLRRESPPSPSRYSRHTGRCSRPALPPAEVYRRTRPSPPSRADALWRLVCDQSATRCPARRRLRAIG